MVRLFIMKVFFATICFLLSAIPAFSQQDWTGYSISGSVRVWFPATPSLLDTLGQQYVYLRENDEMMMANVAAVPHERLVSDTFSPAKAVDRFVNDIIAGSTRLIYTDVVFKGTEAKYYKIRMDKETDQLFGLVVDGYCFFLSDTIYNLSYWRFKPGELFDYSRQRLFYDKIEIRQNEDTISGSDKDLHAELPNRDNKSDQKKNIPAIVLGSVVVILAAVILYQRSQQQKADEKK
jgi:hypothetical protein